MTNFWETFKSLLLPALISGVIGYLIGEFKRRGKVNISNVSLLFKYHGRGVHTYLHTIEFNLQIINTAEKIKQLEIHFVDFTVGSLEYPLHFEGLKFPPVLVLKEKSADIHSFNLKFESYFIELPLAEIHNDECIFRLKYTLDKKTSSMIISSKDFELKDTSLKWG